MPDTVDPPADLETARALIASLRQELKASQHENLRLRHQLDLLCRKLFGRKSDKVDPQQLQLALEQLGNEQGAASEPVEMDSGEAPRGAERQGRKKPARRTLPKNLPRRQVILDLPDEEKVCGCGQRKQQIGQAVSEKLDYVPAVLEVVETVRPRYSCPKCHEGVSTVKSPVQAVEKGLAAEGLLAHVVVSKYGDHLPLFRLSRIFERHGLDISRSTMCGWVADVADALAPIGACLHDQVVASRYLNTDDTPITVLGDDGPFKGRLWTYLDPIGKQVVFDATATHERAGPERFLRSFAGHLQADAYVGYDALYRSGRVIEVGCWAHARRRFVEALETDSRAATIITLVRDLYGIERELAAASPSERTAARQARSLPLLERIDEERQKLTAEVLPKSPLGDALRYLHNQRGALGRFIDQGHVRIDNNAAESQLRVVALGRKNWLFAGSMDGAHRAALLYSLVQSCKLVGVEPWAYLRTVLLEVATTHHRDIETLTPKGWAERNAAGTVPASA